MPASNQSSGAAVGLLVRSLILGGPLVKSLRIVVVCFAVGVLFALAAAAAFARTAGVGGFDGPVAGTPGEEQERIEREERERLEKQKRDEELREPGPGQCECPSPDRERTFIEQQERINRELQERREAEALRNPPQVPAPPSEDLPVEASTPPETAIARHPAKLTSKRRATFAFTANQTPAAFECKLDGGSFQPCGSDFRTKKLKTAGKHTLRVRARNAAGEVDATPATYSWKVSAAS
jgi:hypothetical protein